MAPLLKNAHFTPEGVFFRVRVSHQAHVFPGEFSFFSDYLLKLAQIYRLMNLFCAYASKSTSCEAYIHPICVHVVTPTFAIFNFPNFPKGFSKMFFQKDLLLAITNILEKI